MTSAAVPSSGYAVTASALTTAGTELSSQAQQLATAAGQIGSATVSPAAFGSVPQAGQVAQYHNNLMARASQATGTAQQRLATIAAGVTNSARNYTDADQRAADAFRALMGGGQGIPTRPGASGPGTGVPASDSSLIPPMFFMP